MIPLIWRYLLAQYFKVMGLCVVAFIAVLLTARLDEITRFIALSPSIGIAMRFILLQIPYILPIVIPVSCLISSILLVQGLSKTHELTAFRACGISLKDVLTPILFCSALVAILNFYIISELTTSSHYQTLALKEELRAANPLHLLRNKQLIQIKGGFFSSLGSSKPGKHTREAILALPNKNRSSISLFLSGGLDYEDGALTGDNLTLITAIPSQDPAEFDRLLIENAANTAALTGDFSNFVPRKGLNLNNDYFTLKQLLEKLQGLDNSQTSAISACCSDIVRRISLGFAAFTFTLIGLAFGINIGRTHSAKKVVWVVLLAGGYITAFFMGKSGGQHFIKAAALYTIPHLMMIFSSAAILYRVNYGIDGRLRVSRSSS